jgi:hypothetical protein
MSLQFITARSRRFSEVDSVLQMGDYDHSPGMEVLYELWTYEIVRRKRVCILGRLPECTQFV